MANPELGMEDREEMKKHHVHDLQHLIRKLSTIPRK